MADNRIFQRGVYTKKEKVQTLNGELSSIFETNWSTLQTLPVYNKTRTSGYSDQGVVPSNFKVKYGKSSNTGVLYNNGKWVPPNSENSNGDDFWTYDEISEEPSTIVMEEGEEPLKKRDDGKIKLDNSSLRNFATYGSLHEYIKTSFQGIVENFPAALWIVQNQLLHNPFNINLEINYNDFLTSIEEEDIRIFAKNFDKYEVIKTFYLRRLQNNCSNEQYNQFFLSSCKLTITSVYAKYRYIYVLKQGYRGFSGNLVDPVYGPKTYDSSNNKSIRVSEFDMDDPSSLFNKQNPDGTIYNVLIDQPNIPVKSSQGPWVAGKSYVRGNTVCVDNKFWMCLTPNSDATWTPSHWTNKINTEAIGGYHYPIKLIDKYVITLNTNGYDPNSLYVQDIVGKCGYDNPGICGDFPHIININYQYDEVYDFCNIISTQITFNNDKPFWQVGGVPLNGDQYPTESFNIVPKATYITDFFEQLNELQKTLLNRYTVPQYSSNLSIPIPNEEGVYDGKYEIRKFIWRTEGGWNLDIESTDYLIFVKSLSDAALYLDESRVDWLYRMLTHESIKNMDWSLERIEDYAKAEAFIEGGNKMSKVLRVYGRNFDEIKKYIHGIEIMNNISYNQLDNYPDSYLKTNLEYEGWQVSSLQNEDNIYSVTPKLYYGWKQQYDINDVTIEFYRRALINSPYIARWKGTKHGLEMVMNLFGVARDQWEIKEIAYIATGSKIFDTTQNSMFNGGNFDAIPTVPNNSIVNGVVYSVVPGTNVTAEEDRSPYYVVYHGEEYRIGDTFWGTTNTNGTTDTSYTTNPSGFTKIRVIINQMENIAAFNNITPATLNGGIIDPTNSALMEGDFDISQSHDSLVNLAIEKFYFDEWKICPICGKYNPITRTGGGLIRSRGGIRFCTNCEGRGWYKDYIGVPAFKGNSDYLYYQQYGGWYQDSKSEIGLANEMEEIFNIPMEKTVEGVIFYVKNDADFSFVSQIYDWVPGNTYNTYPTHVKNVSNDSTLYPGLRIYRLKNGATQSGMTFNYGNWEDAGIAESTHYWVLINKNKYKEAEGWHNIRWYDDDGNNEMDYFSFVATNSNQIITISINGMSSVKENTNGNNPHTGGSEGYDNGINYIQHIGREINHNVLWNDGTGSNTTCQYPTPHGTVRNCQGLFKYVLDNSQECIWNYPQYYLLENIGFQVTSFVDTKKCWAIELDKTLKLNNSYEIKTKYTDNNWCIGAVDWEANTTYKINDRVRYKNNLYYICVKSGSSANFTIYNKESNPLGQWVQVNNNCSFVYAECMNTRKVDYGNYGTPISNPKYYQLINTKNVQFIFYPENEHDQKYFIDKIMPYVEEMLPSTAIIDISWDKVYEPCQPNLCITCPDMDCPML